MRKAVYFSMLILFVATEVYAQSKPASAPTPIPKGQWVLIGPPFIQRDNWTMPDVEAPEDHWMVWDYVASSGGSTQFASESSCTAELTAQRRIVERAYIAEPT